MEAQITDKAQKPSRKKPKGISSVGISAADVFERVEYTTVLEQMIKSGIPIKKARFQTAVNNADNEPQSEFSIDSAKKQKRAEMWLTPVGVIFMQVNAKKETCYFGTASANVVDWYLKD